jgi:hypothetical protein
MHNRFSPRNPALPEGRHNPSPCLAEAIRNSRQEIANRGCGNYINYRIAVMNMALWGRTGEMRSWGTEEALRGNVGRSSVFPEVRAHTWPLGTWRRLAEWRKQYGRPVAKWRRP